MQDVSICKTKYLKKFKIALASLYLTSSLFTLTYYFPKICIVLFKEQWTVNSEEVISKNPYTIVYGFLAPQVGLEPTTLRLTAACSANWAIEEYICQESRFLWILGSGNFLLSQAVSRQVSSTLRSLTSVFGMGTGGSSLPLSPDSLFWGYTLKTKQCSQFLFRLSLFLLIASFTSTPNQGLGQALDLLVPVSSIHYCTYTSGLSTM